MGSYRCTVHHVNTRHEQFLHYPVGFSHRALHLYFVMSAVQAQSTGGEKRESLGRESSGGESKAAATRWMEKAQCRLRV